MPGSTNSVLRYRWARAAPTARGIALARHASWGSAAVRPGPFPLCVAVVRSGNPASRRRPGVNVCRQVAHQIPETVKHRPLARPAILLERARRDAEPFGGLGRGEKHRCRFHVILLLLLRAPPDDPGTHVRQSNSKQHRWGRVVLQFSKTTPPPPPVLPGAVPDPPGAAHRAPTLAPGLPVPPAARSPASARTRTQASAPARSPLRIRVRHAQAPTAGAPAPPANRFQS